MQAEAGTSERERVREEEEGAGGRVVGRRDRQSVRHVTAG